ncbi:MAG: branched-chain-amino-acid transaminase, partial [Pseudomonadota bacterium]
MASAFGTEFTPEMIISWFDGQRWGKPEFVPSDTLALHPASHVLHYASTCFEGLKAFRHDDGSINLFRMDRNVARFEQSARLMALPAIDTDMTARMIVDIVERFRNAVPQPPGSMYIRPTLIGTEPSIGKAAAPSATGCQYVLLSPVGDYFSSGAAALRLLVDDVGMRCAPHNGMIKCGGNYASALRHILQARAEHDADQVLFCPGGDVQETGAANFLLIEGGEVVTKALDETFLHGVTRESVLTLARDAGYTVSERELSVDELLERATRADAECALSGTAAVLTPVGTLIYGGREVT